MKKKKLLLITIVLLILIGIGLGFIRFSEIMAIQSPQTTIRINVLDINSEHITLQTIVDMKNTNSFDISMKNFKIVTTTPDGHEVLNLPLDDRIIPSNKQKSFTSTYNITFNNIFPNELTSRITGDIKILTKTVNMDIKIITSTENIVDIDIPTVKFTSQFEEITNDCINFSGTIDIENLNNFEMRVKNISTSVYNEIGDTVGIINTSYNNNTFRTKGSLRIDSLNSDFINIDINGSVVLKIAGAEKVLPISAIIQVKTPDFDDIFSNIPISITIKPNNKISDRKIISDIIIVIVNPTKINFVLKDVIISTYLIEDGKSKLINEKELDVDALKVGDTTILTNHIEIPPRNQREIKNPDWVLVAIKGKITINDLEKCIPIEIKGYQDMHPFT